jgi:hypothetical protein
MGSRRIFGTEPPKNLCCRSLIPCSSRPAHRRCAEAGPAEAASRAAQRRGWATGARRRALSGPRRRPASRTARAIKPLAWSTYWMEAIDPHPGRVRISDGDCPDSTIRVLPLPARLRASPDRRSRRPPRTRTRSAGRDCRSSTEGGVGGARRNAPLAAQLDDWQRCGCWCSGRGAPLI